MALHKGFPQSPQAILDQGIRFAQRDLMRFDARGLV
jgi:hypothetical protein